jgi:immune inhibitor A
VVIRRATGALAVALLCLFATIGAAACGGDSKPTPTPPITPTSTVASPSVEPTLKPSPSPTPASIEPPDRDPLDLAVRFLGLDPTTELVARDEPFDYAVGDAEEFYLFDLAGEPTVQTITATLRRITDHAYFFVEAGIPAAEATLERVGSDFETIVYPTVRAAFGSERTPGVDSDERITLLHANIAGTGGYFNAGDELPRSVYPFSNEREMLYLEAGILSSPGAPYNALVAHELQHMIHSFADASEESWVNEGISQVAAELVGGGSDWLSLFLSAPDTGLIEWPELGSSAIHYGASELFFSYLLDRFGGRNDAKVLLSERRDSIGGIRAYLEPFGVEFEQIYADWLIANYLDEESGKYAHAGVSTSISPETSAAGRSSGDGDVSQFAADYIALEGARAFRFDGSDEVTIGVPDSGGAFYWSQRGDDIDSRMTREFDLTGVDSAELRFDTWFDIEEGWDFAYVAASTDGGRTWEALPGLHTTDHDPVGQSYGPAYTGDSDGWIGETIDLSAYAGGEVLVRFEYITDGSTHGIGFAVDNIQVPETAFMDNGEDAPGWEAEGFVTVDGPLPQRWIVQVIDLDSHDVERLDLDADNVGTVLPGRRSVIVVSAVTEGTSERAPYTWSTSE